MLDSCSTFICQNALLIMTISLSFLTLDFIYSIVRKS
jgi:hypothetical protein